MRREGGAVQGGASDRIVRSPKGEGCGGRREKKRTACVLVLNYAQAKVHDC